jgi:acyl-coenzyme A synthetase/AMP-(fatty) acid ligase/thioesterase domain-containing protein
MIAQKSLDVFPTLTLGGINDTGLGESWDSVRLWEEIDRRAASLADHGIGRGSIVAIGHGGTARFFADLLAVWKVGAAAACLDQSLTAGEIRNVINFSKSAILLSDRGASIDRLDVSVIDLAYEEARTSARYFPVPDPEDPALLLFTSGTTGTPKGVVLSFRALRMRIEANLATIGAAALQRTLVTLPTHFGHGLIGNSLTPLLTGSDIVLHPLGIQMATSLGSIIDEHGITFLSSVPTLWRLTLPRSAPPIKGSLVRVHVGSAPFPAELWSQVVAWSGAEVVNCYGTTETANWIAGASSRTDEIAEGLIGRMWGGSAAVLDDDGQLHQRGSGEILIKSPSLLSAYLNQPDLTRAALHDGWYRTGDRGSIDPDGRLWLSGRIKDEINRAGFKVQPAEIDSLLEKHPAIAEACVFAINDPIGGEAIAAAVRLKHGTSANRQSLRAWCLQRVRREAIPEQWFFVSEIPRTARGKISRDVVRQLVLKEGGAESSGRGAKISEQVEEAEAVVAPISSISGAVEHAWTEVFGHESYVQDQPLNETGGDSLDKVRMWLSIEKMLGVRLSMDALDSVLKPSELRAALIRQFEAAPSKGSQPVFLMTPAEGDSPALSHFRALLKDRIHWVLIDYPGWREMIDSGARFDVLVEAAVEQICRHLDPNEECCLAGYSFGGFVAIEAARRLLERKRRISFLGIIDTRLERPTDTQLALKLPLIFRFTGKLLSALILISAFRPLKLIAHLASRLPDKSAFIIEFMLNTRLRTKSLLRLHLQPLPVPLTLFRSDEGSPPDNGWGAYCNQLAISQIGGDHHSILEPPFREVLAEKFVAAVEASSSVCRSKSQVEKRSSS